LSPRVRLVASKTGETAFVGGWVDGTVGVLMMASGHHPVQATRALGFDSYAHASSSGKLLLALADPATRETFLVTHELRSRTRKTITTRRKLDLEFERIRVNGYAIDDEEFAVGLCCISVPIEGLGHRYALGVSAPSERFRANRERYLGVLRD